MRRTKRSTGGGVSRIGDVLPQLIVRYGLHRRRNLEQIEEAWRQTVGEKYADLTQVSKLHRGTLTVKVPHNAFMQELSFRQAEFVTTLAALLEGENIRRIRFEV